VISHQSWRDAHDARLPLTRADLRSQNDLTAPPKKLHPRSRCQRSNKAVQEGHALIQDQWVKPIQPVLTKRLAECR
jgi:hypothetical protein